MNIPQTLLFTPRFPAGEIIESYIARCGLYNRCGNMQSAYRKLLRRSSSQAIGLPNNIHQICEAFCYQLGNEQEFLDKHTLFDFFACGMPIGEVEAKRMKLISTSVNGPIRPARFPILLSSVDQQAWRCPECDRISKDKLGFSYTDRTLVAPFVSVCPIHSCWLLHDNQYPAYYEELCRGNRSGKPRPELLQYSRETALCICTEHYHSPFGREALLKKLLNHGWMANSGRVNKIELTDAFHKKFGAAFDDARLKLLCTESKYVQGALQALVRQDRSVHPVWCVLLHWFLDTTSDFSSVRHQLKSTTSRKLQPTEAVIRAAIQNKGSVRKAAADLQIDVSDLVALARKYHIHVSSRPKRITPRIVDLAISDIRSGSSVATAAKRAGISLKSAYRIVSANPDCMDHQKRQRKALALERARDVWQKELAKYPDETITSIRQRVQDTWVYLYRHDTSWLRENSVPRNIAISRRPRQLATGLSMLAVESLMKAVKTSFAKDSRPHRISGYRLIAQSGLSEYIVRKSKSVTSELAAMLVEDQADFALRRVRWGFERVPYSEKRPTFAKSLCLSVTSLNLALTKQKNKGQDE